MKKRWIVSLMVLCMMFALSGCGMDKIIKGVLSGQVGPREVSESKETLERSVVPESTEAVVTVPSEHPVFAGEVVEGYTGFKYLEEVVLESDSDDGSDVSVYIPIDDYSYINEDRASSTALGVEVEVELNPYINGDEEDYLPSENLEDFLEEEFNPFYSVSSRDVVISDIQNVGENGAWVTVEYCQLGEYYDNGCIVMFSTYYFEELADGTMVLVGIHVDQEEATGKTPQLLAELEAYFQMDVNWDADKAAQKLEAYLAAGVENVFSTGYLLFELPEGWENDYTDWEADTFCPGGDRETASSSISIAYEYSGEKIEMQDFFADDEEVEAFLSEMYGIEVENATMAYYGETCMGDATKMSFTSQDTDGQVQCEIYLISSSEYLFIVYGLEVEGATESPFPIIEDILLNGQLSERYK